MLKKYQGAFLGAAIGDALGAAAQSLKPGRVNQLFGRLSDYIDFDQYFSSEPKRWRLSGLYGSPTQLMLSVSESILLSSTYDPDDIINTLRSMLRGDDKTGVFRSPGAHLTKALDHLSRGGLYESGSSYPGLDASCSVLSLAMHFRDDPESMLKAVVETALLFSSDPRSVGASAAFASACRLFVMDDCPDNASQIVAMIREDTRQAEQLLISDFRGRLSMDASPETVFGMSEALEILPACLREDDALLVERTIVAEANRREPPFRISSVNQGFAPVAMTYILWLALKSPSLGPAILNAINGGKEARIVGSLTGTLAGLRFGSEQIPPEWLEGLVNAAEIKLRGEETRQGYPDWSIRRDLVDMEYEWSSREREEALQRFQEIQKQKEKKEKKRGKDTSKAKSPRDKLPDQVDADFAPSPGIVFDGELPDPIRARKQKAIRGRKRIPWKEQRRKNQRRKEDV